MNINDYWIEDVKHRSSIQIKIFQLNLIANGSIISFGITHNEWFKALLICPLLSSILFFYWVHQAIAIRLNPMNPIIPKPSKFWHFIRVLTFSIAIISNFILIPFFALVIYNISELYEDSFSTLLYFDYTILFINLVLYFLWGYLQYYSKIKHS